jgi:hypothetical protein
MLQSIKNIQSWSQEALSSISIDIAWGKKITVSWEQLVDFVLDTINEINQDINDYPYITNASKQCR